MVRYAAVALLLLPAAAWAQNGTTTCTTLIDGRVQCQTRAQPSGAADYTGNPFAAVEQGRQAAQRMELDLARKQAGQLIAAGRCTEARNVALRTGDLDFAAQVQQLCQGR